MTLSQVSGESIAPVASCNNCGSSNYIVVYDPGVAQVHQIVKCEDCELMYAFPLEHSNLEQYATPADAQNPLVEASPEVQRARNKLPDYMKIEEALSEMLRPRGDIVEIGSYSGILMHAFRLRGWRVKGVEPDGRAVEFSRNVYGIDVCHGTLKSADLDRESADAVVMLHVIEHVDDPAANVRAVMQILRSGGIFVVETPVYDSLMYRLLGRRERSISCNGHVFFYTESTLVRLLNNCGFTIIKTERVGRTMSLARLLWSIGVMSKSDAIQRLLAIVGRKFALDKRFIYLNARDMIRIYARKS